MDTAGASSATAKEGEGSLTSRGFLALLATQFTVTFNDNTFRWIVVPIGKYLIGGSAHDAAIASGATEAAAAHVRDSAIATILSVGLAAFVLPYLLLAAPAGYLADRFSKRKVIVWCKFAEMLTIGLGIFAIYYGHVWFMFVVLALLGSIAALFGPAKFGSIPELVHPDRISSANGVMGLVTVVSIVLGTIAGNFLYTKTAPDGTTNLILSAVVLISVAAFGWAVSFLIDRVPAGDPTRKFPINFAGQTVADLRKLFSSRGLRRVAIGTAFFWGLASLAQINVDFFAENELYVDQSKVGPLLGLLSLGVAGGCVLAGIWSAGKVELGLVPLGALGISISSVLLFAVPDANAVQNEAFVFTCIWLFTLGISSGLYDVPLASYLQQRSPAESRGSILAASNFLTFSAMLLASFAFYLLRGRLEFTARGIFLLSGMATLAIALYALFLIPQATIRFLIWLATRLFYRVRISGLENVPDTGPGLLVSNHISWLDGVMLITMTSRPIRFLVYAPFTKVWYVSWLAKLFEVITVDPSPRATKAAVLTVRAALARGELVCIFPEGGISRTGQVQSFKPGMMLMLKGNDAPVIPVYLDELWGSIFSFRSGKFLWKFPRHWPYPVSIHVGKPLHEPKDAHEVRAAVTALGGQAMSNRQKPMLIGPRAMLRKCRSALFRSKIADSMGTDMTGGAVLMRSLIFVRLLGRLLKADEKFVGILLPPSAGGVLANAAVTLTGRVSVNLNYTMPSETVNYCIQTSGIRHVLTSRKFMEKVELKIDAELIYLEDVKPLVTTADKLLSAVGAYVLPAFVLEWFLGLTRIQRDDLMTVIFTSGSTGKPKGVMLTFANIGHNTEAIDQVVQLNKQDVLCGILPFFHSFGFTVTLWSVLALDIKGIYHFSPLDARQIGKLCKDHRATILLSTPTFLRGYLRRCDKEDLATLDVVVAGAEKLPTDLIDGFDQKFGVRPVEGYGTTELSPLVSVNIPPSRAFQPDQIGIKEGTVGRPVPGVAARIIHLETGEVLGIDEPGMLEISGPNVMPGYLHEPVKTAAVMHDGWYVTGDVAMLDADGFIRITGRQSRFSKIGGEMIPHVVVEEILQSLVGGEDDQIRVAVTAVPDERKGERLVVLYTQLDRSIDECCKALTAAGLPNLGIPGADSFYQVDAIPVLGTGKLDLQKLKQLALEKCGVATLPT